MDTYILPGMLLKDINVFELKIGDRVYDKASGRSGSISNIEDVAFIRFDGGDTYISVNALPSCIYIGQE